MESRLKRAEYHCKELDETIELRQLSALGLAEIIDRSKDERNDVMLAAITCRHGVVAWSEYSAVEIAEAHTPETILELAAAIDDMTGRGTKKNSGTGQVVDLSSDSPSRSAKTRAK